MLQEVFEWGQKEREKTAEQLYQHSKILPKELQGDGHEESNKNSYLRFAAEKGHPKAIAEWEKLKEEGWIEILKTYCQELGRECPK